MLEKIIQYSKRIILPVAATSLLYFSSCTPIETSEPIIPTPPPKPTPEAPEKPPKKPKEPLEEKLPPAEPESEFPFNWKELTLLGIVSLAGLSAIGVAIKRKEINSYFQKKSAIKDFNNTLNLNLKEFDPSLYSELKENVEDLVNLNLQSAQFTSLVDSIKHIKEKNDSISAIALSRKLPALIEDTGYDQTKTYLEAVELASQIDKDFALQLSTLNISVIHQVGFENIKKISQSAYQFSKKYEEKLPGVTRSITNNLLNIHQNIGPYNLKGYFTLLEKAVDLNGPGFVTSLTRSTSNITDRVIFENYESIANLAVRTAQGVEGNQKEPNKYVADAVYILEKEAVNNQLKTGGLSFLHDDKEKTQAIESVMQDLPSKVINHECIVLLDELKEKCCLTQEQIKEIYDRANSTTYWITAIALVKKSFELIESSDYETYLKLAEAVNDQSYGIKTSTTLVMESPKIIKSLGYKGFEVMSNFAKKGDDNEASSLVSNAVSYIDQFLKLDSIKKQDVLDIYSSINQNIPKPGEAHTFIRASLHSIKEIGIDDFKKMSKGFKYIPK